MDGIETRIVRLEKENRFLKGAGVVLGVGLLCVLLMGQAPAPGEPGVVTARGFRLVRADGTEAGHWLVSPVSGLAGIYMLGRRSGDMTPASVSLGLDGTTDNEEESLLMLHGKGTPGGTIFLRAQPDGQTFLALHDKTGHMDRAKVFVTPEGEGKIVLHSDAETISWHAP
jgi:hypothetical protein